VLCIGGKYMALCTTPLAILGKMPPPRTVTLFLFTPRAEMIKQNNRTDQKEVIEMSFVALVDIAFVGQH